MRIPAWMRYAWAIVAAVAVVLLRLAFNRLWGPNFPFLFYFPITLFTGLFVGFGPAVVGLAVMAVMTAWWVMLPLRAASVTAPVDWMGLAGFLAVDLLIAWIAARHRRVLLEQEESGRALEDATRQLRQTLDTAAIGLTRCSRDLRYVSCNTAYAALLGLPAERIAGRAIADVIGEEALAVIRPHVDRVLAGERVEYEAEIPFESCGPKWLHVSYTPWREDDGSVNGWVASMNDVTLRVHAERARRDSEERLRLFVEHAPAGVAMFDRQMHYLACSRRWRDDYGLKEDVIGRSHYELFPEISEEWKRVHRRGLDGEVIGAEADRFPRADGTTQHVNWEVSPWFTPEGDIGGIMVAAEEVTHRIEAQEALRASEQALREADARKDEFLATLAHELRNPLAPMRNMLEVLKRTGDGDLLGRARATLERQVGHLTRLVDDLLDVSRISRGKIGLRKEPVDLVPIVRQAIEANAPAADRLGQAVTASLPEEPLRVDGDPVRLAQILGNLLDNASKYTGRNGRVHVAIERRSAGPDIGGEVIVSVRDTGIGIPPEKLGSVFDMFAQVGRATDREQGGLGIGLSLVKRLVDLHGGSVEARSGGPGRGSEFVVRLPRTAGDAQAKPADPAGLPAAAGARRILVVDDNQDNAASLDMILKLAGHTTATAGDGLEALDAAEKLRPDVILLDLGMPNLNGFDACRRLRELPWGRDIVIVAISGWGQAKDRQRSMEAGFDGHLVKPVDYPDLMRFLERPVARARGR
ncbi:MAG TPA: PAS domain-containing protein [Candidatus Polarisedimenticolia bacterium]|nr:PAS domain-containing protein [Candidatus Polarisedimenticolia bacterium]